jgi:hypothetical protein
MSAKADVPVSDGVTIDDQPSFPVCRPNISGAGRRRRQRVGYVAVLVLVALLAFFIASHVAWYWRGLLCLPGALAAVSLLQVRRNTCIARAAEGTFEHEDFSTTKAPDAEVSASRRVAARILRDSALIGLACGAIAIATALI